MVLLCMAVSFPCLLVDERKPVVRFVDRTVGVSPQQRGPVRARDPHVLAGAGASPVCAGTSPYDTGGAALRGLAAMHLLRLHGIPASPVRRTGARRDARPTVAKPSCDDSQRPYLAEQIAVFIEELAIIMPHDADQGRIVFTIIGAELFDALVACFNARVQRGRPVAQLRLEAHRSRRSAVLVYACPECIV